jgi:hypothetical protein
MTNMSVRELIKKREKNPGSWEKSRSHKDERIRGQRALNGLIK